MEKMTLIADVLQVCIATLRWLHFLVDLDVDKLAAADEMCSLVVDHGSDVTQ
jgi:hypothetical protein